MNKPGPIPKLAEDRFWSKVDKSMGESSCWPWKAFVMPDGYGQFGIKVGNKWRLVLAHRFAFESEKGRISDGLDLDHICRNRSCCNPVHLEAVTRSENLRRGNTGQNGRKLSDEDVEYVQSMMGIVPQRELAKIFKMSESGISKMQHRPLIKRKEDISCLRN